MQVLTLARGLVTVNHKVKTSIYFFSGQSSNSSFCLLKPAHKGHTDHSSVGNCLLVKLRDGSYCKQHVIHKIYHKNFWKIWFQVACVSCVNQSIKTRCCINFPWSYTYICLSGPELRRYISQKLHQWHFHITPGSSGEAKSSMKNFFSTYQDSLWKQKKKSVHETCYSYGNVNLFSGHLC